jgi:Na+-driven multidrug efflux pump
MCLAVVLEIPCMVLTAVLRGCGQARSASVVAVTVMAVQVVGVAVFGGVLGLGLTGLPCAVVASGIIGVALDLRYLHRYGLLAGVLRGQWPVGGLRAALRTLSTVGIPVGGTFVVLFLANSATLRVLAGYGEAAVSGFGIASTTQIVLIVPAMGLGTAIAILTHSGGGRPVLRRGVVLAAALYAILGAVIGLAAGPIARAAAPTAAIADVAAGYLQVVGPTLAFVGVQLTVLTVLEQTGSGFVALAFNVGYFGLSIGVGAALAHGAGSYRPLFSTMAVANVLALAALAPLAVRRLGTLTAQPAHQPGTLTLRQES